MSTTITEPWRTAASEQEFKRRLVELGLLKPTEATKPMDTRRQEHELVTVQGLPLSELIVLERR